MMKPNLELKIMILGREEIIQYDPEDSFFSFHLLRFPVNIKGTSSNFGAGKDLSDTKKKEILESINLFVLQICFENVQRNSQVLSIANGPFRPEHLNLTITDLKENQIERKKVCYPKYPLSDPESYEIGPDSKLCFDLFGEIHLSKLIFPIYEYELQHGNEYFFQLQFQGILSNKVKWLFK